MDIRVGRKCQRERIFRFYGPDRRLDLLLVLMKAASPTHPPHSMFFGTYGMATGEQPGVGRQRNCSAVDEPPLRVVAQCTAIGLPEMALL